MRKLVMYYLLGFAAIIILWLGIRYLTLGRLVVTTNSGDASISLFKLGADNDESPVEPGVTKILSRELHPGKYVVKVISKSFSSNRVVYIKAHKTLRYVLNSTSKADLEPVYPAAAQNIVADKSALFYVDSDSEILYKIDDQNNVQPVGDFDKFTTVSWGGTSYGVGRDDDGQFFSISGGIRKPLAVPFATNDNKAVIIAVSATKQVFIAHGSSIYAATDGDNFKKIFTAKSVVPILAAANNKVAVLDEPGDVNNKGVPPLITVLDTAGRVLAKRSAEAVFGVWSDNGKYLALTGEGSEVEILNSSLEDVSSFAANSSVGSLAWAGNSLYYPIGEGLWMYDLPSQTNRLVANAVTGNTLSNVAVDHDHSYVYLTVDPGIDSQVVIYRYSLQGKKSPYYVYQFPFILPNATGDCQLSFANFTRPTLLGRREVDAGRVCADTAQSIFKPYGIDPSSFGTHFSDSAGE